MKISNTLLFFFFLLICSCKIFQKTPDDIIDPPVVESPLPVYTQGQAEFHFWKHSPLHVANFKTVNFQVKATDHQGITKVELYIFEYQLFKNPQGLPSKKKSENRIWGLANTWNLDGKKQTVDLNFEYQKGFASHSNVEYVFKIINSKNELTERFAMFDSGASPWTNDKILLYSTTRQPMNATINLCFFPDIDFKKDWNKFLIETEKLIYDGYHENNMISNHKDLWNFYYTRQEADGYEMLINPGNENAYPTFMKDNMISGIDAFGMLHQDEYPDRTYFRTSFNFLASNVFTTEVYNYGTAVHETAHAIFRLSDEYDGCACFQTDAGSNVFTSADACAAFNEKYEFSNPECNVLKGWDDQIWFMPEKKILFRTEQECQDFNVENVLPKDSCQIFIDPNGRWFRAFKGICIMQDDGDQKQNPFQRTCQVVIDNFYDALKKDIAQSDLTSMPSTILFNNIFGYEAVVLVELSDQEEGGYDMQVMDVQYGIPSKNVLKGRAINIEFTSSSGEMIHQVSVDNPSHILFHGKNEESEMMSMGHGSCVVAIPFNKGLARVSLDFEKSNNQNISIKGISKKTKQEFDVAEKVKECYGKFLQQ